MIFIPVEIIEVSESAIVAEGPVGDRYVVTRMALLSYGIKVVRKPRIGDKGLLFFDAERGPIFFPLYFVDVKDLTTENVHVQFDTSEAVVEGASEVTVQSNLTVNGEVDVQDNVHVQGTVGASALNTTIGGVSTIIDVDQLISSLNGSPGTLTGNALASIFTLPTVKKNLSPGG